MPEITDEMVIRAKETCKPTTREKISIMAKDISVDAGAGGALGTAIGSALGAAPVAIAGAAVGSFIGIIAGVKTGIDEIERPDPNCVADILQQFSQGRWR